MTFCHHLHSSINSHFCIQRIENGLNKDGIHLTLHQSINLFLICSQQIIISQISCGRITYIGRHRTSLIGRTYRTSHKTGSFLGTELICYRTGQLCTSQSHFISLILQVIVSLRDTLTTESVRCYNVSSNFQVLAVNV